MQSKFIDNILTSSKIIMLFLIIVTLLITKSPYLILFFTILEIIILILIDKNVNNYVQFIKNNVFWLLFILIIYIIIYRDIILSFIFMYKLLLSIILIECFILTINFQKLHSGIYRLIKPLKIFKLNVEAISFNMTVYIYFLIYYSESKDEIKYIHRIKNRKSYGLKNYLLPRVLLSINKIEELVVNLKIRFYNVKKEKFNIKSIILPLLFVILFFIVVFKEVI